jgi:hypothetical protein
MSILWCGGEDIDFQNATPPLDTTAGRFRSGYPRGDLNCTNWGNSCRSVVFPGGAVTVLWFSVRMYVSGTTSAMARWFGLIQNSTTNKGIWLGMSSGNTQNLTLGKFDGSTLTALATGTDGTVSAGCRKVDVYISGVGAGTVIKVYIDGSSVAHIDWSGDISSIGITGYDCIGITAPSGGTCFAGLSEFVVADEDTRTFSVVTNYPNGAGDNNDWTGAYTDVDESTMSDSDLIYVNSDAKDAIFNLSDLPSGTFSVRALRIAARCMKSGDSSIANIKLGFKIGSPGTIDVGSNIALPTNWGTVERIVATINGVQPSTSDIGSLESVLRSAT